MPPDQRGGLDNYESRPPVEETRPKDECEPRGVSEPPRFDLVLLIERELLAEEYVLGDERHSATGKRSKEDDYVRYQAADNRKRGTGRSEKARKHDAQSWQLAHEKRSGQRNGAKAPLSESFQQRYGIFAEHSQSSIEPP
jgi:hypothetical protein